MNLKHPVLILFLLALTACSIQPRQGAESQAEQQPVVTPETIETKAAPPATPTPPPAPQVAILVSRPISPYTKVAEHLEQALATRATVYHLWQTGPDKALAAIPPQAQLVSVGLDASLAAREKSGQQHIFCQVFNYSDYHLIGDSSKGVSMVPGAAKTFTAWRAMSPGLTDVAVITGPGLEAVIAHAREEATRQGIKLHHLTVKNDKDYYYHYKQIEGKVQGYWLLPDNRVLSVEVLRDIMTFSVRNGKQVAVFSDELLQLGGLFSVSSDYRNIADKVVARLAQSAHKPNVPGPGLMPLDEAKLRINTVMARRLGLVIPKPYREYAGEEMGQ